MFGTGPCLSEPFWRLAETVERLRSHGLTTDRIASITWCSATQVVGVEFLARQVREELGRLVRS